MRRFVIAVLFVLGSGDLLAQPDATTSISTANSEPGDISYISYQNSSITTTAQGQKVWSFTVKDSASGDGLPTLIVSITVTPGGSNQASWSTTIKEAALFVGSSKKGETVGAITNGGFTLENTGDYIAPESPVTLIPDGASVTFDLYLTFHSVVTDNQQLQFTITHSNISQNDYGDVDGWLTSTFATSSATSSVLSNKNRIAVTANHLQFTSSPSSVFPNIAFGVTVQALDALGNIDVDPTSIVTIAKNLGDGTLGTSDATLALSAGSVSWSDLTLDVEDDSVTLVASGAFTSDTTDLFDVTGALMIESFEYFNPSALETTDWDQLGAESTTPVSTVFASLTLSPYPFAAKGGAVAIANSATGQDVFRTFASQSTGSVYFSVVARVASAATSSPVPFMGLGPTSPSSVSDIRGALFAQQSGATVAFGIAKAPSLAPDLTSYSAGYKDANILLVVKYTFNGGDDNDVVDLFVQPTTDAPEPSPTLTSTVAGSGLDASEIGSIILQQATAGGSLQLDGIRVSSAWADVALPVQLTSFSAASVGLQAVLTWSTATETDNYGFDVERRVVSNQSTVSSSQTEAAAWKKIAFIPGAGTSPSPREYSFTDANVAPGRYVYRIRQIDRDGSSTYYGEAEVEIGLTAKAFVLNDAFPNPFNPTTNIDFSLATAGPASLKVYDLLGREVASLFDAPAEAGRLYRATWDAAGMPSGMYFVRLSSGGSAEMKRLMLVK